MFKGDAQEKRKLFTSGVMVWLVPVIFMVCCDQLAGPMLIIELIIESMLLHSTAAGFCWRRSSSVSKRTSVSLQMKAFHRQVNTQTLSVPPCPPLSLHSGWFNQSLSLFPGHVPGWGLFLFRARLGTACGRPEQRSGSCRLLYGGVVCAYRVG